MLLESDILFTSCSYPVPFLSDDNDDDDYDDNNNNDNNNNNNDNNNNRVLKLNYPPLVSSRRATNIY